MSAETPLHRNREYLLWLGGDLAVGIGVGIGTFAFPLIAFAVTGSAAATGVVGLVQGAGMLAGMLPGGVVADRFDRRRLRLLSAVLGMGLQALLAVVLLTGAADLVVLAALAATDRFRASLLDTASDSMLKQLVGARQLPSAVSVNQGRDAAVELGSGPLGGALLGLGLAAPALAHVVGSAVSAVCTVMMRGDYRPRDEGAAAAPGPLASLTEGLRWMLAQRVRIQIGVCAALINLAINGVFLAVMLMLAAEGVPAALIGVLSAVVGLAVLVGSVLAPSVVARVPSGPLVMVQLLVVALAVAAIPLAPNLWVIAGLYAVMGLAVPMVNAAIMGFFVTITPVEMQGRAQAMTGLLATGLMPLGPAIAGFGIEHLGSVGTMVIFAAICAAGALVALVGRGLRRVPVSSRWEQHAVDTGLAVPTEPVS